MWTTRDDDAGPSPSVVDEGLATVPHATSRSRMPDEFLLASRIDHEAVFVVCTESDDAHAHVRAGEAVQMAWLEANSRGLAVSVSTQPLHLPEVREGIADHLGRSEVPQVLMRFGYPAVPEQQSL
jgi:hypothetical protein